MILPLKSDATVYQIKVTLKDTRPPIWRRFQVTGETRLSKLHDTVQVVMGWTNSHLHEFVIGDRHYGEPDEDSPDELIDERNVLVSQVVDQEGQTFGYDYDFGDDWNHELLVEKILPNEAGVRYPRCLEGARACPPEDSGGPWGYEEKLQILKNPAHPNHREIATWMRKKFDAEAFDLSATNKALKSIR